MIDRVARRVSEPHTLAAIDEQTVEAAQSRCPKQLAAWLLRLVVRLEPLAFEQRHRRALAERRVTVVQGADGMGYVTGEVSASDAAAIDGMLAAAARASVLTTRETSSNAAQTFSPTFCSGAFASPTRMRTRRSTLQSARKSAGGERRKWLEVEDIDPDTGELLGTHIQAIDADGEAIGEPVDPAIVAARSETLVRRPRQRRIAWSCRWPACWGLATHPASSPIDRP